MSLRTGFPLTIDIRCDVNYPAVTHPHKQYWISCWDLYDICRLETDPGHWCSATDVVLRSTIELWQPASSWAV